MKHLLLAAPAALLALAACDSSSHNISAPVDDPGGNQAAAAPQVELPPAIKASKAYRCKDNSLIWIDFFDGDKQANVHEGEKAKAPVVLRAEEAGKPYTAEGYSLTGSGESVSFTSARGTQTCKGG